MTISVPLNKEQWLGNGATTVFAYSFALPSATDAQLLYTDTLGNTTIIAPGDYTLTGVGQPTAGGGAQGGTVTYPLAGGTPIAAGTGLTLVRMLPLTQTSSFTNQGGLWPTVVESTDDTTVMQIQQVAEAVSRALQVPTTDVSQVVTLPSSAQRANALLGFNSQGWPIAVPTSTASSLPPANAGALSAAGFGTLGTPDDTAVIQAGINFISGLGGGTLWIPPGLFLIDGLVLQQGVVIEGAARGASILRGKPGGSGTIIATSGFAVLTGTNSNAGPSKFGLRHISIDGNKANRTGGSAVTLYGFDYDIDDVEIYNAYLDCLYSEWGTYGGSPPTAQPTGNFMEARINRLRTFGAGRDGVYFRGPHDSLFSQCLSYINQSYGFVFDQATAYEASGTVLSEVHAFGNVLGGVVVNCLLEVAGTLTSESNSGNGITIQNPYGQVLGGTLYTFTNAGVGILISAGAGNNQFACVSTGNTGDGLQVDTYGNQISGASNNNGGNGLSIGGAATQNQFNGLRTDSNAGYGVLCSSGAANNQLTNVIAVGNLTGGLVVPDGANGLRVDGFFSNNTGTQAALGALGSQCCINIAVYANVGQVGWSGTPGNNFVQIAGGGGGTGVTSTHTFAT